MSNDTTDTHKPTGARLTDAQVALVKRAEAQGCLTAKAAAYLRTLLAQGIGYRFYQDDELDDYYIETSPAGIKSDANHSRPNYYEIDAETFNVCAHVASDLLADRTRQAERIAALEAENAQLTERAVNAEQLAYQCEGDMHYERHAAHAYQAENARMRPLVEALATITPYSAEDGDVYFCMGCHAESVYYDAFPHDEDCRIADAIVLVAQWQTPAAPDAQDSTTEYTTHDTTGENA